ncbi:MAG: ABC transporter permease, partial [Burkholderiales bacterium]
MARADGLTPVRFIALALRLLGRDWRAGELRVLVLAIVVAVASLTTVAFFADRVGRTISREANQLLGADLVVISDRPVEAQFLREAQRLGLKTTTVVRFPSMTQFGAESLLTEVKAVGDRYPLRGRLQIRTARDGPDFEPGAVPLRGTAWADERLLRRMSVGIGERIKLGDRDLVIAAMVTEEPESSAGFFNLGPRLMFNQADLSSTRLITVGSRATYRLLVAGDDKAVGEFRDFAQTGVGPGQRVEDIRDARPEIKSALARAQKFLGLSALLTVILAGVAIALAARRHLQRHLDACAVMRCLGATQSEILWL